MNIIPFEEIDSTSSYLKNKYREMPNLSFCVSKHQTSGKGRMNRVWESKKGENLLFSFLLKKPLPDFELVSSYSAYLIMDFLRNLGIEGVSYKWPNDVYVKGKKICGILLEGVSEGDSLEALVVGIGLNVNQKEFNPSFKATSMALEMSFKLPLETIKEDVFYLFYTSFKNELDNSFIDELRKSNYLLDKEVSISTPGEVIKGIVRGLDDSCFLLLEVDGEIRHISSGEASILK